MGNYRQVLGGVVAALLPRDEYVAQTRLSRSDDRGQVVNPPTHPLTDPPANHQSITSQPPHPPANPPTQCAGAGPA